MRDALPILYYSGEYAIPHSVFDRCIPRFRNFNDDILRSIYEQITNTRGLDEYFELTLCPRCEKMTFVFMDDDGQRWCPVCKKEKDKW